MSILRGVYIFYGDFSELRDFLHESFDAINPEHIH